MVDVVRSSRCFSRWEARPYHRPVVRPRRELAVLHTLFVSDYRADESGSSLARRVYQERGKVDREGYAEAFLELLSQEEIDLSNVYRCVEVLAPPGVPPAV